MSPVRVSALVSILSTPSTILPTFPTKSVQLPVLYGYALAYLVAPETFSSANVVELIGSLPEAVKYADKAILAAPFAFHCLNGLRHLGWDMGKCECLLLPCPRARGARI